jgi:hypothetical protein
MPENKNTFITLNEKLKTLSKATKQIDVLFAGLDVANEIMHILGIPYDQIETGEDMLGKAFPNARFRTQKVEKWFVENPISGSARVALNHYDKNEYPIESKFYMLSDTPRKEKIAFATQLFPNWEDSDRTMIPNYKVGIDFFLCPKTKSLLFVATKRNNLRVIEFAEKLTHTQIEILNKIQGCVLYKGLDETGKQLPFEPQRTIHTTIWNALDLKEVNKKFYEGIADHFIRLCQFIKENVPAGISPETIEASSKIFANRIINRLLFVWFLRKKGIINKEYGYFDIGQLDSTDYYEQKLKPLFFKTLNIPVENRPLLSDMVTPYLNGGLFEAQDSDWPDTKVLFPEGWFNSLYEHLEHFNFTTDESSAEYEQVAIDPEMLGRVFENLLASIVPETANAANERNNKGAFYTPREIVSYMCKEALKQYLRSKVSSDKFHEGINNLIEWPDNTFVAFKSTGTAELWGESTPLVRQQLVKAINELKIIDPACGSGAFPIGMLQLLLKTCDRLSLIYDARLGEMRLITGQEVTNLYQTKLFLIRSCLYGVDIEPMAAEISRLRAWLSLIIDDKTNVDPLPNLDFNFVCANTLIKLPPKDDGKENILLVDNSYETRFQALKDKYFNAHDKNEKLALRQEFYALYNKEDDNEYAKSTRFKAMTTWNPFNSTKPADFFDPEVMFNVAAFSIVIGNPPYIQLQSMKELSKDLYAPQGFETYAATGDMYCLFIEKGLELCKKGGSLTFITSNKWMRAGYGEKLRRYLAQKNPILLVDFGGTKIFDSATVDTDIIQVVNEPNEGKTVACNVSLENTARDELNNLSDFIQQNSSVCAFTGESSWVILSPIEMSIKKKIESVGTPLKDWNIQIYRGVLTGLNEAFIIPSEKREEILDNCLTKEERARTDEIIRPILRGRDIERYSYNWAGLYLICTFPSRKYNIDDYPALKAHLLSFGERVLAQSGEKDIDGIKGKNARKKTCNKWFETQDSIGYWDEFSKPKILYSEIVQDARFYLDNNNKFFPEATAFSLTGENLDYLCVCLNSSFISWVFKTFYAGGGLGEHGYRYKKAFLLELPLPHNLLQIEQVRDTVNACYEEKTASDFDSKVNEIIYKQYGLSAEEISYIETNK